MCRFIFARVQWNDVSRCFYLIARYRLTELSVHWCKGITPKFLNKNTNHTMFYFFGNVYIVYICFIVLVLCFRMYWGDICSFVMTVLYPPLMITLKMRSAMINLCFIVSVKLCYSSGLIDGTGCMSPLICILSHWKIKGWHLLLRVPVVFVDCNLELRFVSIFGDIDWTNYARSIYWSQTQNQLVLKDVF